MTKFTDRPPDGCCEGCWDARPVPGLERDYYLCDYHGSPDYGHVVYYRHCCQEFSLTDRGEDLFMVPAPARLEVMRPPAPTEERDETFWERFLKRIYKGGK